jgi:signal peptidase I
MSGAADLPEPGVSPGVRWSIRVANVLLLLLFAALAYFFIYREARFFLVPSGSMIPTLMPGDRIVTLNEAEYQRGDIVVIWDEETREDLVKRIAGVEGDELSIEGGALFLNGAYASEPYVAEPMRYEFQPLGSIATGQVLLLGDNRNHSADSSVTQHTYPTSAIKGRVRFIYFPLQRRGLVQRFPLVNSLGQ